MREHLCSKPLTSEAHSARRPLGFYTEQIKEANWMKYRSLSAFAAFIIVLLSTICSAQPPSTFAPLAHWKAVVLSGSAHSIKEIYSSEPPARVSVVTKNSAEISAEADAQFWTELKPRQLSL